VETPLALSPEPGSATPVVDATEVDTSGDTSSDEEDDTAFDPAIMLAKAAESTRLRMHRSRVNIWEHYEDPDMGDAAAAAFAYVLLRGIWVRMSSGVT